MWIYHTENRTFFYTVLAESAEQAILKAEEEIPEDAPNRASLLRVLSTVAPVTAEEPTDGVWGVAVPRTAVRGF